MALEFPYFLRRRLRLHEARRALLAGSPAVALERLADPCLAHSADAERLRARAREALGREAGGAPEAESGIASALEGLLEDAISALSGLSRCASLVSAPKTRSPPRHNEFVNLSPGRALGWRLYTSDAADDTPLVLPAGRIVRI